MSNTPIGVGPGQLFEITHPFHPLRGRKFTLVAHRYHWGLDRVYFYDDDDRLVSIPTGWTTVSPPDPFVLISAGRSAFRAADLLQLANLIKNIRKGGIP